MKRFIDYLRADPRAEAWQLDTAVPFVIDNVAQYFLGSDLDRMPKTSEPYSGKPEAFPCIAPPFENCFMEYKGDPTIANSRLDFVGLHILAGEALNEFLAELKLGDRVEIFERIGYHEGFSYAARVYAGGRDARVAPSKYGFIVCADKQGIYTHSYSLNLKTTAPSAQMQRWLNRPLMTGFMALSLMSCKNVKRVLAPEEKKSRQVRRAEERHPDRAVNLVRYYTLEIDPMKKVLETEGGASANGLKKAMHICRGHFATYEPERPLLGKYAGRFWVPAHIRGSLDRGLVVKDYAVKGPAA